MPKNPHIASLQENLEEGNPFSERTKTNLEKFSVQLEKLQVLEDHPIRHFLESFPIPFAMLDENLRYLLHSSKWTETFGLEKKDLIGKDLVKSGLDISETSIRVYREALAGKYPKGEGKDLFLSHSKKRVHLYWTLWKKKESFGGILLIAGFNPLS